MKSRQWTFLGLVALVASLPVACTQSMAQEQAAACALDDAAFLKRHFGFAPPSPPSSGGRAARCRVCRTVIGMTKGSAPVLRVVA